jgi:hypothetical protein
MGQTEGPSLLAVDDTHTAAAVVVEGAVVAAAVAVAGTTAIRVALRTGAD